MSIKELIPYINTLPDRACGANLEYRADFIQLLQEIDGGNEVQYGDHVYPATPVDWQRVRSLCLTLLEESLDLRVAVCLARALLELQGLSGFIDGLRLIDNLLRERWDDVHPQLLAEDDHDPLMRLNTLAELAVPTSVVLVLKRQQLGSTMGLEPLRLADLACIAESADEEARTQGLARLGGLIESQARAELVENLLLLRALVELIAQIGVCLEEKIAAPGISPLGGLGRTLDKWCRVAEERCRAVLPPPADDSPLAVLAADATRRAPTTWSGVCQSREDVVRALDAICAYYAHHEPSSPVPLLAARTRRLATMSFLEAIAELVPGSLADLHALGGIAND
ncbi:type VI secretion system protein TssA [Pseudomonas gingeri]|uniref:type VI secretion system protein TssA n=1 Tax=Pseudomonas gingeri TaxID=117681 RepID=UPI0015A13A29|nr:type VI secretion system protein TssA [Pseudomonas gingeri]NWD67443.1 type VI secretion system protein TssA [Pseudomonas gingeri]